MHRGSISERLLGAHRSLIRAMKRIDLLRLIRVSARARGIVVTEREGGNHTKFTVGSVNFVVGRHRELKSWETRQILQALAREFGEGWWKSE